MCCHIIDLVCAITASCDLGQPLLANDKPVSQPAAALPHAVLYQLGNSYFRANSALSMALFSLDGKYLVAADNESTVWIWSVGTGREVKRLRVPAESIRHLSFSDHPPELHCYTSLQTGGAAHHHWTFGSWTTLSDIATSKAESALIQQFQDPTRIRGTTDSPYGAGHPTAQTAKAAGRAELLPAPSAAVPGEITSDDDPIVVRNLITGAALLSVPRPLPDCYPSLSADEKLLLNFAKRPDWVGEGQPN